MTKKAIKEYYNDHYNLGDEKVVDIDVYSYNNDTFAHIITVSRNHIVYRSCYAIEDGKLRYVDGHLLG